MINFNIDRETFADLVTNSRELAYQAYDKIENLSNAPAPVVKEIPGEVLLAVLRDVRRAYNERPDDKIYIIKAARKGMGYDARIGLKEAKEIVEALYF